ncbi:MarR family winged helix-turn-helix transcriptional regulator [Labrys portucalensis]|uniref:MarR family winged helix-turn-helix transcriptional regulator n=1 Tax=Labrys neptuniae TaxID=376174 RepID=A0ABV6ZRC8_9HYPH
MVDVVREFGYLTLGTRLKRLGERLQADTQRFLEVFDDRVPASQYPFLAALAREGPLGVGELAQAVGITQPGATRSLAQLEALGLVEAGPAPDDQRRRLVTLTGEGHRLVDTTKQQAWPLIEAAVADLCGDLTGPLLEQLSAIEDRLAVARLDQRAVLPERNKP